MDWREKLLVGFAIWVGVILTAAIVFSMYKELIGCG